MTNPGIFGYPNAPFPDTAHATPETQAFPSGTVILRKDSARRQILAPTAIGQIVQLPPTLDMQIGEAFSFLNNTPFPVKINDAAQNIVNWVMPGTNPSFLIDEKSVPGKWGYRGSGAPADSILHHWGAATQIGTGLTFTQTIALAADTGTVIHIDGSNGCNITGYKIVGGEIETTAAAQTAASGIGKQKSVPVTSTEIAVITAPTGAGNVTITTVDFDTSAMTLTVNSGSAQNVETLATSCEGLDADSSGSTIGILYGKDNTTVRTNGATISAGTPTVGTAATLHAVALTANQLRVRMISTTLMHTAHASTGPAVNYTRSTLSGATVTPGTPTAITGTRTNPIGLVKQPGANTTLLIYEGNENVKSLYAATLADTGSAITFTETQLIAGHSGSSINPTRKCVLSSSSGNALMLETKGPYIFGIPIRMLAGVPTLGALFTMHESPSPDMAKNEMGLSGDQGMLFWGAIVSSTSVGWNVQPFNLSL
jgi:hypothetical protein